MPTWNENTKRVNEAIERAIAGRLRIQDTGMVRATLALADLRILAQEVMRLRELTKGRPDCPVPWSAELWNRLYPPPTRVRYYPVAGEEEGAVGTTTRSLAWVLCGTPVVKVDGQGGGVAISHLAVIPDDLITRADGK